MAKPIDEKLARLLDRMADVPARYTGKSVAWHMARNERLKAKFYSARGRLKQLPIGSPLRRAIRARMTRLGNAGVSARRDAAAQYKWDQRQRDKAACIGLLYGTGPIGFPSYAAASAEYSAQRLELQQEWWKENVVQPYQREFMQQLKALNFAGHNTEAIRSILDAPRYASGGTVGLRDGEVPAILSRGRFIGMPPELGMGYGSAAGRVSGKAPSPDNLPRYTIKCPINFSEYNKENATMLQIEVGKKYNTRDGRVGEVVFRNPNASAPHEEFLVLLPATEPGKTISRTCAADGRAHKGSNSNRDLVSEYVPFKIAVGGIYMTRDGADRLLVTAKESNGTFATLNLATRQHANYARTETGHAFFSNKSCNSDLVKPCPNVTMAERAAAEMYRLADELLRTPAKRVDLNLELYSGGYREYRYVTSSFELTVMKQ